MALIGNIILLVLFHTGIKAQTPIQNALCDRFFLKIMDESYPHKAIEGLFTMQKDRLKDGFPIYTKDNNLYFYYHGFNRNYYIVIGNSLDGFIMLAKAKYRPPNYSEWINEGENVDPFRYLLSSWDIYDSRNDDTIYFGRHGSTIKITCVDESFVPCASGKLFFNKTVIQSQAGSNDIVISIPDQVYFEEMYHLMWDGRPVFRKVGGFEAYLYYLNGSWVVGPDYQAYDHFLRCSAKTFRPEFMDCRWDLYEDGYFHSQEGLGLDCRGIQVDNTSMCLSGSNQSICHHSSLCGNNSIGELVCYCERGYQGELCEKDTPTCPPIPNITNGQSVIVQGFLLGDASAYICNKYSVPKYIWTRCVKSGESTSWAFNQNQCLAMSTTSTYTTTYPTEKTPGRTIDFDDFDWLRTFIITMACILQLVLPLMIWCCANVCQGRRTEPDAENPEAQNPMRQLSKKERQQRRTHLDERASQTFSDWADELKVFSDSHPELEHVDIKDYPENLKMELQAINDKYRRATENEEQERKEIDPEGTEEKNDEKPKKSRWMTSSLSRIFSIDFNVSMWLWAGFLSGCGATKCTEYGEVLDDLTIFAFCMVPISYVWVLVESMKCRENQYLKSLGDIESAKNIVNSMREGCPVVTMSAVGWHMELRTRTVSYTDAQGRIQYRTETYWEKVITRIVTKVFEYGYWTDLSSSHVEGIRKIGVTKIKMNLDIAFGDDQTTEAFERVYQEFKVDTMYLDVNVDHSYSTDLPGFRKRVATYMDKKTIPKWMKRSVFWVATFFGCTWFFRMAFQKNVASATYAIRKKIYLNPPLEIAVDAFHHYIDQSDKYEVDEKPEGSESGKQADLSDENPVDQIRPQSGSQGIVRLSL